MSSPQEGNRRLARRLRSLWTLELFDSFFLPGVLLLSSCQLDQALGLFSASSAALVAWLLWQGSAYWWLKLRALRQGTRIPAETLRSFRVLRPVNWVLIGLVPVLLVVSGLVGPGISSLLDLVAGAGFYSLAVLEQVNYYHYQLMYDCPPDWRTLVERKRLMRSSLARALDGLRGMGRDR